MSMHHQESGQLCGAVASGRSNRAIFKALLLSSVAIPFAFLDNAAVAAVTCGVESNMLSNCGFETGSTTSWTSNDADGWTMAGGRNSTANSAVYSAFGEMDYGADLKQTLTTTLGNKYQITFSYKSDGGQSLKAYFGNTLVFQYAAGAQDWHDYTFRAQAIDSSTVLKFVVDSQGQAQYLDEIGVVVCTTCTSNSNTHTGAVVDTSKGTNVAYTTDEAAGSGSNITFDGGTLQPTTSNPLGSAGDPKQVAIQVWETGGTVNTSGGTVALAGSVVNLGTLKLAGGGRTELSGTITNATNAVVQIDQGNTTTLVDATGTTVSGGTFRVTDGSLYVNRSVNSQVQVDTNGTLRGTGTISQSATVSGVLRPGNSPGTLTFAAPVTQGAGSTLQLDVDGTGTANGAGNYSRVLVTGAGNTYTINSTATIAPELRGLTGSANNNYTPPIGQKFTGVVEAEGGVSGRFASITQPTSGLLSGSRFIAVYNATSIDLYTTVASYGATGTAGIDQTRNQSTIGGALDGLESTRYTTSKTLFDALAPLSASAIPKALRSLSGEGNTALPMAAVGVNRGFGKTIGARLSDLHGTGSVARIASNSLGSLQLGSSGGGYAGVAENSGIIGKAGGNAPGNQWTSWVRGMGTWTNNSGDGNNPGFRSVTGGGVAGADKQVRPNLILGVSLGYGHSSVDGRDDTGTATIESYRVGPYLGWTSGRWFTDAEMGASLLHFNTNRNIAVGTLSGTATAEGTGYAIGGQVESGFNQKLGKATLTPSISIRYDMTDIGEYSESGAPGSLNLTVADKRHHQLRSGLGGRLAQTFSATSTLKIEPDVSARWEHDFLDQSYTTSQSLNGSSFNVMAARPGRDAAVLGFGVAAILDQNLRLYAHYDAELRENQNSHSLTAGARYTW